MTQITAFSLSLTVAILSGLLIGLAFNNGFGIVATIVTGAAIGFLVPSYLTSPRK